MQIGKNYTDDAYRRITGEELLELAWNIIEDMQYMGGGMVIFLEANNEGRISVKVKLAEKKAVTNQ